MQGLSVAGALLPHQATKWWQQPCLAVLVAGLSSTPPLLTELLILIPPAIFDCLTQCDSFVQDTVKCQHLFQFFPP